MGGRTGGLLASQTDTMALADSTNDLPTNSLTNILSLKYPTHPTTSLPLVTDVFYTGSFSVFDSQLTHTNKNNLSNYLIFHRIHSIFSLTSVILNRFTSFPIQPCQELFHLCVPKLCTKLLQFLKVQECLGLVLNFC